MSQMPFSSPEVVSKSEEFLKSLEQPECPGCKRGVRMCHHTPCLGTVEDIEKMINAGYARNLMLDWWMGDDSGKRAITKALGAENTEIRKNRNRENPFGEDVAYLVPATVGKEGKKAAMIRSGSCNLLVDDKCTLHNLDLKPIQGRLACCSHHNEFSDGTDVDERIFAIHTWNTQRGKDLIERWKQEVGFNDNDEPELPANGFDIFEMLLGVIKSKCQLAEGLEDEMPKDKEHVTNVVEKPFNY